MKKTLILSSVLTLFFYQNSFNCFATELPEQQGFITTFVEKTKEVDPNMASVTFTKENTAKSVQTASAENKAAVAKMNEELTKLKNSGKKFEINTGSYSVRPNYSYKNDKKNLIDYTVVNSVTVKTADIDLLGKIIDIALTAGADRVSGLNFTYESSDNNNACKDLIWLATHETREIAKVAANAANHEIKRLRFMSTSCVQDGSNPTIMRNFAMKSSANKDAAQNIETSVTPHKIKIRASINAEYYVK